VSRTRTVDCMQTGAVQSSEQGLHSCLRIVDYADPSNVLSTYTLLKLKTGKAILVYDGRSE
jgi:phosphotransacetylase